MFFLITNVMATPAHQTILYPTHRVSDVARTVTPISNQATLSHTVYGYLPYWTTDPATIDLNGLTHIAYFNAEIEANGTLSSTYRWNNAAPDLIPRAHSANVEVHLCVTAFSDSIINSVLPNSSKRATLIAEIQSLLNTHGADGVNIDIEGMDAAQRDNLTTFIAELSLVVPDIVIATPAVDWSDAYDYAALANYATLFIMAYDYHWSGGDPGPVDPLFGGGSWGPYSIDWSVNNYLDHNLPADKLIVGIPLYGRSWSTVNSSVPGTSTGSSSAIQMTDAIVEANQHGSLYDVVTESPYILYPNEQVWYPDVASVETRILWALDQGVQGVGFWALGYEDGVADFWPMMSDIFTVPDPEPEPEDNNAPIANAGLDQSVVVGSRIALDGRLSTDPDGDPLSYMWTILGNTALQIESTNTSTSSVTASEVGTWTIQLMVSDGELMSNDTMTLEVYPAPDSPEDSISDTEDTEIDEGSKAGCSSANTPLDWWPLFLVGWIPFRRRMG